MDLTGSLLYFGSPSARQQIAADLAEHRLDLTVRKEILWESETATDAEVRAVEVETHTRDGRERPGDRIQRVAAFVAEFVDLRSRPVAAMLTDRPPCPSSSTVAVTVSAVLRTLNLLHEMPSPSSDWTARQPHVHGWLG